MLLLLLWGALLCWWGLPWWTMVLWAVLAGVVSGYGVAAAFVSGFAAGSLIWYGVAMMHHLSNGGQFAGKIGQVFAGLQVWQLLLVTGLLGGLLAGFGAMTGSAFRALFVSAPRKRLPYARRRRR